MNERISFLVDKTSDIMPGVYTLIYESGERGVEFSEDALEQFVGFLVHECLSILKEEFTQPLDWMPSKSGIRPENYLIMDRIEKHFGVEE